MLSQPEHLVVGFKQASVLAKDAKVGVGKAEAEQRGKGVQRMQLRQAR